MKEDSALTLKKECEQGKKLRLSNGEARNILKESDLIKRLLIRPKRGPDTFVGLRAYEWRLLELAEIPYSYSLKKVQEWLDLLIDKSFVEDGFSLTGNKNGLLACHNAMITTILMKMEYKDKNKIDAGINWILKYQSVERGKENKWPGKDLFSKYGGCMKKTPCFYGVVKSMITLTEYKNRFGVTQTLNNKLNEGLEYILKHNLYKKLSTGEPIESSIVKNFYPYTYKSNIIEILSLLKSNNLLNDNRCTEAIGILRHKRRIDGFWQADATYMKSTWVEFDRPKKPGQWISYIINDLLKDLI